MKKYSITVNIEERSITIVDRYYNEVEVAEEHLENRYGSIIGVLSWNTYPLDPPESYDDMDETKSTFTEIAGIIQIETNRYPFPKECGVDGRDFDACLNSLRHDYTPQAMRNH